MKKVVLITLTMCYLIACGNDKKTSENEKVISAIAAGGQSEEELKKEIEAYQKEEEKRIEEEKKHSTTLQFDRLRHDFGNVKPESENTCRFKVTNTGKNPLIIENVSASCGCTTPHKPEQPIPPGKSDYIEVGFHPKPGQLNEIIKTVTVVANTTPKVSEISIRAYVK